MEKAIKITIENGLVIPIDFNLLPKGAKAIAQRALLLDPAFWQVLGKGLGKNFEMVCSFCGNDNYNCFPEGYWTCGRCHNSGNIDDGDITVPVFWYKYAWYRFTDHLAEGKDIESFFTNLLTP